MAADKMREDHLQAVWFAAGTAALVACIERAVVVSLFAHWRVWAFLALNLLLLAILFTSKRQIRSSSHGEDDRSGESEIEVKKRKQEEFEAEDGGGESVKSPESGGAVEEVVKQEVNEQISKEELNQRVEAFIARFREHLNSDAKGFRRRENAIVASQFV